MISPTFISSKASQTKEPSEKDQPPDEEDLKVEEIPMISASQISQKLRSLASFPTPSLTSEVKRLASLSFDALQREFQLQQHINKLPIELLGEIFRLCQVDELEEGTLNPESHLSLMTVCKKWCAIVFDTPFLWRHILVSDSEPWPRTRRWLELSGTCPLQIIIQWSNEDSPEEMKDSDSSTSKRTGQNMLSLMDVLGPHVERLESFSLSADDYSIIYHALDRLETRNFTILRSLELNHYAQMEDELEFQPEDLSHRFDLSFGYMGETSLKDARFWGVHILWDPTMFSQLRRLTLAYHSDNVRPSAQTFFEMLSASAPTLVDLTIESSGPAGGDYANWPKDPIEFPVLRDFRIAFLPPVYSQNLLLTIDAPRLESLHIDLDEGEDDFMDDWNRLVEILCTSGYLSVGTNRCRSKRKRGPPLFPNIRRCNISALPVDTIHLGIFFYYHSQISELTLNFNYLSDDLLAVLGAPLRRIRRRYGIVVPKWVDQPLKGILDGSREQTFSLAEKTKIWLVPQLKTFKVYGIDGADLRMLTESRMTGMVPLHAIYYSDGTSIKTADRLWLKEHLDHFEEFEDSEDEDDDEEEEDEEGNENDDADEESSDATADGDTEDED